MTTLPGLLWHDKRLREKSDTRWAAGCRALQTWWRQDVLGVSDYGPHNPATPNRLVGSMLPLDAPAYANFVDPIVLAGVEGRLAKPGWGGLVSEDRLRRNLLSSQPLAFNLFGYLKHHPRALLAWLTMLGVNATEIVDVRVEWAPPKDRHFGGGAAFDAAIFYSTAAGIGLVGVECKYAEDLNAQKINPRPPYMAATRSNGYWRSVAAERLRAPRLVQLWLNTLLAQSCVDHSEENITEALVVVMACGADASALDATVETRTELLEPWRWLTWCSYEALLDAVNDVEDVADWSAKFRTRYLDFSPIVAILRDDDPRRTGEQPLAFGDLDALGRLQQRLSVAQMMTERVLGGGSILEQIAETGNATTPTVEVLTLVRRLEETTEALRQVREIAAPAWATVGETEPDGESVS